jgi:two-component system, response regulator PdtaR
MTEAPPLILVAEDEPLASMALRAQLEALGFQVLGPARDGDEALALGSCFPIDLALFDFQMPKRTGLDAATALFDLAPVPVILLSGFDAANLPDRIPRPPIFASVTKPADLQDLRRAIATANQGFDHWLNAEPVRKQRVHELRQERTTIAQAIATLNPDGSPPTAATRRLLDTAASADRSPVDVAREILRQGE